MVLLGARLDLTAFRSRPGDHLAGCNRDSQVRAGLRNDWYRLPVGASPSKMAQNGARMRFWAGRADVLVDLSAARRCVNLGL